jgi:ubiquinone/menaquinone biosynthesis C-methylase UbiE
MRTLNEYDMEFFEEISHLLIPYNVVHCQYEFGRGIDSYLDRVKNIGLDLNGRVLDAGGAIGNWSIPLAYVNEHVDVVDINAERLFVGYMMSDRMGVENISFRNMSIEALDFPDEYFDAIVCYSVIMFTNIEKSLAEFSRVLKPGGKLYIQADLWRWYFFGKYPDRKPSLRYWFKFFLKKLYLGTPKLLTGSQYLKYIKQNGFDIASVGQDGQASFHADETGSDSKGFYPTREHGKEELIEICAKKRLQ